MRNTMILILSLLMTACGSNGGSSPSASGNGTDNPTINPTCKNLYSVWSSTTDQEQWDFTTLVNNQTNNDYFYRSPSNVVCGYPTNPNHNTSAIMNSINADHYEILMVSSLALTGDCANYVPPGSMGHLYGWAEVIVSCNEIQICQNYGTNTCKTFH